MIDQTLKCFVWKFVLVCKIEVVKNLVELRAVCIRELIKNLVEFVTDSFRLFLDYFPSAIFRNLKTVIMICASNFFVMIFFKNFFIFLIPRVADAFVKKESKNIFLVVRAINFPAQDVCAFPKELLEL